MSRRDFALRRGTVCHNLLTACFVASSLLLILNTGTSLCQAHPPRHDGQHNDHAHEHEAAKPAVSLGTGLLLPEIEGPKPWSEKPALTDPDRFSIAIMTDRTGGHRPGIWMKAVERVNWLRPDFVVSVGDLIEGYTEDSVEIERQWKEFLGFIDQMEMKFFFVPGNHDVTNPKLHRIWREKFGREWYSFDYKGVHFVCLNSEDPAARIGEEQLKWLEDDLSKSKDARWTLVFLHKPIWVYTERDEQAGNPDSTSWNRVAAMLGDRPHTVFAGHVHHYVQYERNGREYYSLATTGGGSALRGIPYGEFDHITWLTMEHDGPKVANLMLDGIQPANVVTETSIERFRNFLQGTQIAVEPILISGEKLQVGELRISLQNDFETAVKIEGKIEGLPLLGLTMESQLVELESQPGEALTKVVRFEMKEPVQLDRFQATSMLVKISSVEDVPLRAEWTIPVLIDKEYGIAKQAITVDGDLTEWGDDWWDSGAAPQLAGASQQWTGPQDCSFGIGFRYDESSIYFAARVTDENVTEDDAITVVIDPRLQLTRLQSTQLGRETISATVKAPKNLEWMDCEAINWRGRRANGVRTVGRRVDGGYEFEMSLPITAVAQLQRPEWSSFQAGVRVRDVDSAQDEPLEVLWRAGSDGRSNRPLAHLLRH